VTELNKHGLTVARRTVTKYRKAMSIPSSRQRRDWTAAPKSNGVAAPPVNDEARMTNDEARIRARARVQCWFRHSDFVIRHSALA